MMRLTEDQEELKAAAKNLMDWPMIYQTHSYFAAKAKFEKLASAADIYAILVLLEAVEPQEQSC